MNPSASSKNWEARKFMDKYTTNEMIQSVKEEISSYLPNAN